MRPGGITANTVSKRARTLAHPRSSAPAIFAASVALMAVGAPAARASTVQITDGTLTIADAGSADDNLVFDGQSPGQVLIRDWSGNAVTAGSGCLNVGSASLVSCAGTARVEIDLGDGDDRLSVSLAEGASMSVDGGQGDDELTDTTLNGTAANTFDGGPGDDVIQTATGDDTIVGGDGIDTVAYWRRMTPVWVDLGDPTFENGGDYENDQISGVENVRGSGADDVLWGSDGPNVLNGGPGDDDLGGRLGDDTLVGGGGFDLADYRDRSQAITANAASGGGQVGERDAYDAVSDLLGGSGPDVLTGDGRENWIGGGDGDDLIDVRGDAATDVVKCGGGADTVKRDAVDEVTDCETVNPDQQPFTTPKVLPAPTPSPEPAPRQRAGVASIPRLRSAIIATKRGAVTMPVSCAGGPCRGTIDMVPARGRTIVLASAAYDLADGSKATIKLRLNGSGKKRLGASSRALGLKVRVRLRPLNAVAPTRTKTVTIKRPRT